MLSSYPLVQSDHYDHHYILHAHCNADHRAKKVKREFSMVMKAERAHRMAFVVVRRRRHVCFFWSAASSKAGQGLKWSTLPRGSQSSFFLSCTVLPFESERTRSRLLCIMTQVSNVIHLLLWQQFHVGQTNQWQKKEVIDKFFIFPRTLLFFPNFFLFFSFSSSSLQEE